jgi:regulator of protease activity HflC (stomatin/prohibitin superfamily)
VELPVILAIVAFLLVVLLVIVYLSIRVVQQYERMVVFRLGKTDQNLVRSPGLNLLIPIADRPIKVDLRETLTEVRASARSRRTTRRSTSISWCSGASSTR